MQLYPVLYICVCMHVYVHMYICISRYFAVFLFASLLVFHIHICFFVETCQYRSARFLSISCDQSKVPQSSFPLYSSYERIRFSNGHYKIGGEYTDPTSEYFCICIYVSFYMLYGVMKISLRLCGKTLLL